MEGPTADAPTSGQAGQRQGSEFWPLALARQLDDALLHLRFNETDISTLIFTSSGAANLVAAYDRLLSKASDDWFIREVALTWRRVLKRIDMTSRTLVAMIEPGSCFAGFLAEIAFACDRSYMLIDRREGDNRPAAEIVLTESNFTGYPMANALSRLATRFQGEPESLERLAAKLPTRLLAEQAEAEGLVTYALDDIDWDDEIRIFLEERASFSSDALTGLEQNLRFAGPETMETRIFGRLSAWQNWIFQRANAVGPQGALKQYGTGLRPKYDPTRV